MRPDSVKEKYFLLLNTDTKKQKKCVLGLWPSWQFRSSTKAEVYEAQDIIARNNRQTQTKTFPYICAQTLVTIFGLNFSKLSISDFNP